MFCLRRSEEDFHDGIVLERISFDQFHLIKRDAQQNQRRAALANDFPDHP
jgi:hypothetical protein